jgi:hypothetical protein
MSRAAAAMVMIAAARPKAMSRTVESSGVARRPPRLTP